MKKTENKKSKVKSLFKASGLPISLISANIKFANGTAADSISYRKFKDERNYLADPKTNTISDATYAMYRGAAKKTDKNIFEENKLRYDLTVIYPLPLGAEFDKTIGHYHEKKPKTGTSYPEIYEVISGKALFIFQKPHIGSAIEIYGILAKETDKIIVPPEFGHITINISDKPLVISDIFSNTAKSTYKNIKKHHGAAYYILKGMGKSGAIEINVTKNKHYKKVAPIKWALPKAAFAISKKIPLYTQFIKNPKKFDFLTSPEKYKKELEPKNCFKILTKQ